jgi:hypothetical protein
MTTVYISKSVPKREGQTPPFATSLSCYKYWTSLSNPKKNVRSQIAYRNLLRRENGRHYPLCSAIR